MKPAIAPSKAIGKPRGSRSVRFWPEYAQTGNDRIRLDRVQFADNPGLEAVTQQLLNESQGMVWHGAPVVCAVCLCAVGNTAFLASHRANNDTGRSGQRLNAAGADGREDS
ncbi:MAG TPA: hypothetical protein VIY49_00720 [Bryobacteraceae bacterium]